jgi:hypothetical protein
VYHVSGNVREAIVPATVTVSELFVLESHQMKNGSMEIVQMDFILGYCAPMFI